MNILPKKRWHVRTKQNIERVRRDEAQAAKEEKELQRRIQLAEQEARTDLLREKAKSSTVDPKTKSEFIQNNHVNFFQELEDDGVPKGKTNKEYEAEEKARQEKFEKDIGLLTYLGQSSSEAKGEVPWYLKAETKCKMTNLDDEDDETVNLKQKSRLDPLKDMEKYLALKEKSSGEMFKYNKELPSKKRNSKLSKVEELRAKRLKREAEEKQRSQQFLESYRKGPSPNEVIMDDRLRQYNSQFNPHLAKNNQSSAKRYNLL